MGFSLKSGTQLFFLFTVAAVSLIPAPFFSDQGTLLSYPASYILENGFRLILNEAYDTGHPPLPALYLAIWWKLFGVSLLVTKLALLPVMTGAAWFFYRIAAYFLSGRALHIALLLYLFQPTLLAHTISPGIEPFMWLFGWAAIHAVLTGNRRLLVLSLVFLLLCNHRGIVLFAVILIWQWWWTRPPARKLPLMALQYSLAVIPIMAWHIYHYLETGWALSHIDSPWIEHRALLSPFDMLVSGAVYGVRLLEFGMAAIWILFFYITYKKKIPGRFLPLISLLVIMLFLFTASLVPFANPISNRYLLFLNLLVLIPGARGMSDFRKGWLLTMLLLLLLSSSHFYLYNGVWSKRLGYAHDATLVQLHFSEGVRPEMHNWLLGNRSVWNSDTLYSGFPEYHPFSWTDLKDDGIIIRQLDTQQIYRHDWIVLSNIMNEIPLGTEREITGNWTEEIRFKSGPVWMALYRKPEPVK